MSFAPTSKPFIYSFEGNTIQLMDAKYLGDLNVFFVEYTKQFF